MNPPTKFQIMRQHRQKMADCAERNMRIQLNEEHIAQMQIEIRDNLRRIQGMTHGTTFPAS